MRSGLRRSDYVGLRCGLGSWAAYDTDHLGVRRWVRGRVFGACERISCCGQRPTNTFWFSDGYADYLRSFNWAMAAMPELAPKRRDHLLGSSSVVQSVSYGRRRLTYRTFDASGTEVLRLGFRPRRIVAGGSVLVEHGDLSAEGYVVQALGGGDFAVRVRHDDARRVALSG